MRCFGCKLSLTWGRSKPWPPSELPPILLVGCPGGAAAVAAFKPVVVLRRAMALPRVSLGWLVLDAMAMPCDATLGLVRNFKQVYRPASSIQICNAVVFAWVGYTRHADD